MRIVTSEVWHDEKCWFAGELQQTGYDFNLLVSQPAKRYV